ncbi:energy-dependent translational throttle protein EttA [Phocaeicola plebeius]|uniref:energy-dependent translational throttle protein EttA n=2 Tax=Phocaeicola plebeius TaxID=310297 RepID=UPI003AEFF546
MADDKKIIFSMVGVSKSFQNNKQVLKDIYLSFFYGAKIGIIGLNGSGKSTLMKIIAGIEKNYQGEVVFSPGYSVGYLAQEPQLDDTKTVKEVVMEGVQQVVDTLAEYEEINQKFGLPEYYEDPEKMDALFARQAELQDIIDATDAWNLDSKLERAMDALRCPPEDQLVKNLSGGERRRVALCRLLLQKPDILLLDEPTNHLDAESIDWLEQHLQQYEGTVIAVTHDRYFLDHVAGWILELDRGEGIPWKGNYSSWLEQKTKRMEMEEKTASKRRKTLERELEWVRMAPKARQAKGKARLNSYDKLLNEDVKEKEEKLEIFIPNGPRLGNKVIEAKHVAKAYGDKLLFDDLNFMLPPNGIVGVIGPNGAGKTTLFRLIMGLESVDKGEFEVGETVKVAYVDQQHKDIDPNKTVYQVISGGNDLIRMGNRDVNARAYLSRFNFSGSDQEKLCGMLSGGERNRLHLAMALKEEGNVLLLDEPTNHLDAESIDWLEQHLNQYEGTVIAVTHDRYFLDDVAGWILELDRGEGIPWKGNYSSWLEQKTKRMEQEEKTASKRRKTLERELEWVRMAPKARQAKGKARLNSYDKLLNEDQKEKEEKLEIFIPNGPRLGNKVIEAQHVQKAFGDKILFNDLNFMLPPNGIVGVIGPNGAGKTTLFRLIMGLEHADSGTFEVGETVKLAYVDQTHKDISPEKSVYEVMSGGNELMRMGNRDINVRAYLSRFNFSGADQEKKCGVLSGGERNRLHLAMALKEEGNVLLLDEPTNDIDVNTLRALEEGLEEFAGCAVVISHDRWFLDRICTHILAFEGDGNVFFFEGSYSEYESNKMKRLGLEEPKRIRYRKLTED